MSQLTGLRLMLVTDDDALADQAASVLTGAVEDLALTRLAAADAALEQDLDGCDLAIVDSQLPDAGVDLVRFLLRRRTDLPIVALIPPGSISDAVRAIEHGAYDYVLKTGQFAVGLPLIVLKNMGVWRTKQDNLRLQMQLTRTLQEVRVKNQQLERAVDKLKTSAATDALTGLANRRSIARSLERRFAEAERYGHDLACIMIDLDRFKQANDQLGHQKGDELLQLAAKVLEANCRRSDLAGRYGGDEFIVLLPRTSVQTARVVARRIHKEFVAAVDLACGPESPDEVRPGMSVGISTIDHGRPANAEQLIAQADQAMYLAKGSTSARLRTYRPPRDAAHPGIGPRPRVIRREPSGGSPRPLSPARTTPR